MKRFLPLFVAAAVFAPNVFAAAKPVIKYEVVEKFEVAPTEAEIRQAVLEFELAAQEKSKYNKTNLGKNLYLYLPHWEAPNHRGRLEHEFCIIGDKKDPNGRTVWRNIAPDFKWFIVPKTATAPELEKLKILEAAGYISVEEGKYNVACPRFDNDPGVDDFFYNPSQNTRLELDVEAFRYALTDKALKEFFDDSPMWHLIFRPDEGETYDFDRVFFWSNDSKKKTGVQPKTILERMHLYFPIGKIAVGKVENIQKTKDENKAGNTIYTFEYTQSVENVPQGLEKLLEIESPYAAPGEDYEASKKRDFTFTVDALPDVRLKDYPNTPLKYFDLNKLEAQQKYRIAQDEKGKWVVERGFLF